MELPGRGLYEIGGGVHEHQVFEVLFQVGAEKGEQPAVCVGGFDNAGRVLLGMGVYACDHAGYRRHEGYGVFITGKGKGGFSPGEFFAHEGGGQGVELTE